MEKKNNSPIREYLLNSVLDPVLWYTTLIMIAIMYHYYDKYILMFSVVSFAVTYVLFRLFDFMTRKKLLGGALYILTGFIFYQYVGTTIDLGYNYYTEVLKTNPMHYALWFITPQLAMDYNIWYTWATFLLFSFFIASVVYYFSRVRYRVFMSFLIFIIPFLIYGKEYETMPTVLILTLAMSYIFLMFYCRQLKDDGSTVIISKSSIFKSAGIFTLIFAIIASIIPKPQVIADRESFETLISAERFTDRLVASLSAFRGSSNGGQFRGVNNRTPLYYAKTDDQVLFEPLRLKTRTFSDYNYSYDTWSAGNADNNVLEKYASPPVQIAENGAVTRAIMLAAEKDRDFAERYGLAQYTDSYIRLPVKRNVKLYSVYDSGKNAPVPEFSESMTSSSYEGSFSLGQTGLVTADKSFAQGETFSFSYSLDMFFTEQSNLDIVNAIGAADYRKLLTDASDVLYYKWYETDSEDEDELYAAYNAIEDERANYSYALGLLDYDEKVRIKELADKITAGLTNDYDKAKAIEIYFYNNGFNYDLGYVKTQGENVENFLFNTQRGVCYEYATAMVMLSRAAGIPARYCEGFSMSTWQNNERLGTNYVVTAMDAHGYPELYIKGFGWVPFEPTITDAGTEQREEGAASSKVSKAGVYILVFAFIALLAYLVAPAAAHRFFLFRNKRREPERAAIAAMQRTVRIYKLGRAKTSAEAAEAVRDMSGADITGLTLLFDRAAYGSEKLTENERSEALDVYTKAYKALRETKRKNRKFRLISRKN